jgi:RNA polymerase primary sigma factor
MPHRPPHHSTAISSWIKASCSKPPLPPAAVLELSRRIQRWQHHPAGPDHAPKPIRRSALRARDQLVSHNLRLVPHIWRRHRHSLPAQEEATADAFQEAALHLLRAAEKFDPTKGYSFSTYAAFWVRCGFGEVERNGKRLIRFPYDKARLVLRALDLLEQHLAATGELLSLTQLAQRLRVHGKPIAAEQLQEVLHHWAQTYTESLDAPPPPGHDPVAGCSRLDQASLQQALGLDHNGPGLCNQLMALLVQLEPNEQELIHQRYLRRPPLSPHQLRRVMALEQGPLEQLEQRALRHLRQLVEQQLGQN